MIIAALLCIRAVKSIAMKAKSNGLVDILVRYASISELSLKGSMAVVIVPIPKNIKPILSEIEPIFFQALFLMNSRNMTPIKIKKEEYSDIRSEEHTSEL